MPTQDTSKIKEKIINFLRAKGPSLPVHIAKEIGTDTLFASAFLSELISDRKIKTSNMKVGSSSLHYLKGQEQKLENFSNHLNTREKEAFELIKEKKFLKDSELQPVIRVALRSIKDFAIPFKKNNEIYWRYFNIPESEFPQEQEKPQKEVKKEEESEKETDSDSNSENKNKEDSQEKQEEKSETKQKKQESDEKAPEKETDSDSNSEKKNKEDSQEKQEEDESKKEEEEKKKSKKSKKKKHKKKRKKRSKKKEKFFNKVKSFLETKSIEITGIEGFGKKYIVLKVSKDNREYALVAFDQKRIRENDIIKAHKKAKELNLPYFVLSRGTPLKKVDKFVKAVKKLAGIKKIE